jgi:predicted dehydrogenase
MLLVQRGDIGDVLSVDHFFDINSSWITGMVFDAVERWVIYDYCIHWFDITRCWLERKTFESVRASNWRLPTQPAASKQPWAALKEMPCTDGTRAIINTVGGSLIRQSGHTFWIHGTRGVIRGSVLGNDFVALEIADDVTRYRLDGAWLNDGFAGAMGELMCEIEESREPYNSAEHNLTSLQLCLAALESSKRNGEVVRLKAWAI